MKNVLSQYLVGYTDENHETLNLGSLIVKNGSGVLQICRCDSKTSRCFLHKEDNLTASWTLRFVVELAKLVSYIWLPTTDILLKHTTVQTSALLALSNKISRSVRSTMLGDGSGSALCLHITGSVLGERTHSSPSRFTDNKTYLYSYCPVHVIHTYKEEEKCTCSIIQSGNTWRWVPSFTFRLFCPL